MLEYIVSLQTWQTKLFKTEDGKFLAGSIIQYKNVKMFLLDQIL